MREVLMTDLLAVRCSVKLICLILTHVGTGRETIRLDLFLADAPGVTVLFMHGGYWQWNDKEGFEFLAKELNAAGAAFANIEYEVLAIAELHENRRVHLAGSNERCGPHEDDPHLVRLNVFDTGKPVRCAFEPWLRPEALEQKALFPAARRHTTHQRRADVLLGRRAFRQPDGGLGLAGRIRRVLGDAGGGVGVTVSKNRARIASK